MGQSQNKSSKSIEDILKQTNVELTSMWAKLASLISVYEDIQWKEASAKARELLEDKENAIAYLKEVRAIVNPQRKEKAATTKKSTQKKGKTKRDRFSSNYRRLLKIAPKLEEELLSERELYGKSKVTGYQDFNLELLSKNKRGYYLSMSHYYKQNGDLISDPDMVILVNIETKTVEALTFQNAIVYTEVYDNYMKPKLVNNKEKRSQNAFLETWLTNLINQGHQIEFEEDEDDTEIIEPTTDKVDDTIEDVKFLTDMEPYALDEKSKLHIMSLIGQMTFEDAAKGLVDFDSSTKSAMGKFIRKGIEERLNFLAAESEKSETNQPDVSFMDDKVISEIRTTVETTILDTAINMVLDDLKSEEPKLRAVARYFYVKRINDSPLGIQLVYPTQDEIKKDYEKLVERITKVASAEILAENMAIENTQNDESVAETVKHWTKLASVIQKVEGLTFEKAKEKALKLKESGEAENYVLTAFNRQSLSGVNQLYKLNYQQLLRLIPMLAIGDIKDASGTIKRDRDEDLLSLKFEGMEPISKTVGTLSIQKIKKNDIQIIAINKAAKKIWLLSRNGDFESKTNYDLNSASADEKLKANKELGNWLKVQLHYGFGGIDKRSPKSDDFEHPVAILLKEHPIVIEWSEGLQQENIALASLEKLELKLKKANYPKERGQGYSKTKVWFRDYPNYVRIDLSKNESDYDPSGMNLLEWLEKGDPSFNWKQFSETTINNDPQEEDSDDEVNKKIPDFEVGKVKLVEAHIKAGLTQKDIDKLNKVKRGLTITAVTNMKNNTESFFADMSQQAMKPGLRISKTGKLYRENRSNRSDLTDGGL